MLEKLDTLVKMVDQVEWDLTVKLVKKETQDFPEKPVESDQPVKEVFLGNLDSRENQGKTVTLSLVKLVEKVKKVLLDQPGTEG